MTDPTTTTTDPSAQTDTSPADSTAGAPGAPAATDTGPTAPDAGGGATAPATATPAPSFSLGQVVKLPRDPDLDDEEAEDRAGIVVRVTPAAGDTPAIIGVAQLPDETDAYFASDLSAV